MKIPNKFIAEVKIEIPITIEVGELYSDKDGNPCTKLTITKGEPIITEQLHEQ